MLTAKEWNSLLAFVFPESYNLWLFKARVNRHLLHKLRRPDRHLATNGIVVKCLSILHKKINLTLKTKVDFFL